MALPRSDGFGHNGGMSLEAIYNIEPTKENPRSSEGAFVALSSGRVLFVYTQFYGGTADESPARLVGIESGDGGMTWSKPREVVGNEGGNNVMSASLLRLKSGRIALFYLKKNSWIECLPCVRFSDDDAKTWSAPVLMTSAPGYFVLNNDRVIQLSSGRLVAPLAFHRAKGTDPHSSRSFDARAVALWALSDDEGKTWREARSWWALPVASRSGLQEPGVVELADSSLLCFARTDTGAQWELRSLDKGETWSAPLSGPLASPLAPASVKRVPNSARLMALYNDHSGRVAFPKGKRTPLTLALSEDGGKSWHGHRDLETNPDGWYCYTAIHFLEKSILLGYCAGDKQIGGLNRLRIRSITFP
jgi:sialidase-1